MFICGIHKPSFKIINLRENDFCQILGLDTADKPIDNRLNFPADKVAEEGEIGMIASDLLPRLRSVLN